MIDQAHRIHFVGVGGIGMSGLAHICAAQGRRMSGCDSQGSAATRRLRREGVPVWVGHDPSHLADDVGLVVHSAAVSSHEPELRQASARGIPVMTRGEFLAELAMGSRLIGVAGSHGKTTTSAMATQLLVQAGWDPTAVIGGMMRALGGNARAGRGRYFVAETDESDGSFLLLNPAIAIVTNIDREHLNYYRDFETLQDAFRKFVGRLSRYGVLIRCADDPHVRRLPAHPTQFTYGMSPDADVTVESLSPQGQGIAFRPLFRGRRLGAFTLQVPGEKNVVNALAVIALGLALEVSLTTIRKALAAFRGTERRFQLSRMPGDVWLIEDYAHHPVEIQATLEADARDWRHRLVVFQPHRFSRTQVLEREFVTCFDRADGLIVTDIYPAFESPIPGVSGERLAGLIKANGHPCVRYVPREELTGFLGSMAHAGDTIFFLGAGDIGEVCHAMADGLRATARAAR